MKLTLTILSAVCCAVTASAQIKVPFTGGQTPAAPKQAMNAPVYIPPPPGTQLLVVGGSDDCANAAANDAISGAGTFSVTNVGATNGLPDSAGCPSTQLDVWFFWTSTQTGTARLQFCTQTTTDTVITVWADNNGGACPTGTEVVCNDDSCGLQSLVTWPTTAGQTYFFQLGAYGAATTYSANFVVDYLPPPPSNDDCSAAVTVVGTGTFAFDNTSATTSPETPSCGTVNNDVWYYWVAPQSGTARFYTCGGTAGNTKLAVWVDNNGGACPTGTSLACDDNGCGNQSTVSFPITAGQGYFLQLGASVAGAFMSGTFTLDYPPPPPANDDCSTPMAISGTITLPFDNALATTGIEGQANAACLFYTTTALNKDVWFTWTPTQSGVVTVSTCGLLTTAPTGSTLDSRIAVYDGAGCPAASAIACNDDAALVMAPTVAIPCPAQTLASTLQFTAVCGQVYTIQLGQYLTAATSNLQGSISITETPGTPCVPPATPFCFGDGTLTDHTTPCPCGNNGTAGNGCANSANANGANLATTGSTATDDVVLVGSGMPLTVSCIYLQGTALSDTVFGDGVRCAGGTLLRLRTKANVGGASSFPDSVETVTLSQRGGVTVGSGAVRYYQTYYRNSAALYCPPETFNVTNGMTITW